MSRAPLDSGTDRGYAAPSNTQFSVFLDNRVGKLLELVNIFEGHALQLVGMSINDSADHAVVRVLTSRAELARRLLLRNDMAFSEGDVLVVELGRDKTLARLCSALLAAELNIYYAFTLMVRPRGMPTVALSCDDLVMASEVLLRKQFTLLGENDLGDGAVSPDAGPSSI